MVPETNDIGLAIMVAARASAGPLLLRARTPLGLGLALPADLALGMRHPLGA